ncbi:MAG: GNAT family N-acetyltransferase [Caldilineaceae bacterium]|nr:GNAT family N-acetyltransferase [Caldilineaceae bacterium]
MQIRIVNLHPRYFDALTELQYACFPTVDEAEYYRHEHFASHYQIFPEGSFVVLAQESESGDGDEKVVGFGSGIFTDFDFAHPNHSSAEISGNGMYTTHDPAGAWYYAVDLGVHPDYRRHGIGRRLYDVRKALVRRRNKRGIVAGGILADYAQHREQLSVAEYAAQVVAGTLYDSTLTFQLSNGFVYHGLIEQYARNAADDMATLLVWTNPEFDEKKG